MLTAPVLIMVTVAYLGLLFGVAWFGDRRADERRSIVASPVVYSLSLGVYCTAWTYYGSVGRAASSGVGFLPVYLGPTLGMTLAWLLVLRMLRISKRYRITSIADFISSRYGKSQLLGGAVTLIALIGTVPYIALQLKAVSASFVLLADRGGDAGQLGWLADAGLYTTALLAVFAILFGTRHLDATERHEGMVAAIAVESVVKLCAFLAVGMFVTFVMFDGVGDIFRRVAEAPELEPLLTLVGEGAMGHGSWFALTLLSMLSVIFLPRQFQVMVVENVDEGHLQRAAWAFPAYLLLINIFVLPIALAGLLHFGPSSVDPDTFVLTLPLAAGQELLALLVFVGGLSAATGMVIVETVAVSTMVCNDLVLPALLRRRRWMEAAGDELSNVLLNIRRVAIGIVLLLGYLYYRLAGEAYALVSIGLISFTAVAQFAPSMFGGMFWKGGSRIGALGGLGAGFTIWFYCLLLPSFAKSGWLDSSFLSDGPLGIDLLKPEQLLGVTGLDPISHALFWSLLLNCLAYVVLSFRYPPNAREAAQASLFVHIMDDDHSPQAAFWRGGVDVDQLLPLVSRFVGAGRARAAFSRYARSRGLKRIEDLEADAGLIHFAEATLAGAIGSASAHVLIDSMVDAEPLGLEEVMDILDEASQVRAYSRQLEEKSQALEKASAELRAANARLQELDRLKDDFMSSVTHELRTPLTSIRAFSEMLHEDPRIDLTERTRFLGIIVSETERLTRLVNQVLDLAKIESGHAEWHNESIDLVDVIRHSVESTEQIFRDREVALAVSLPDSPCTLLADRDRLIQVVINLLSNAVKFADPARGRVEIGLVNADGIYRVRVADNGPGVSPQDRKTIFEKFRQVGDQRAKPAGTGLGLPISRQIIEHFGGRMWVDSPTGGGAEFLFELPHTRADEMATE
ncbi:MAG: histidine kinase [Rhodocyclaceae bacterium]|nr:histidine kinase [Rhodocyclaceae bacterium]